MPSEENIIIGPPENIIDWCPATQNAWFVYLNLLTTIYAILHWVLYEMWKFYQANKNHRFIFRYLFGMVMLFIGEVAQLYSLGDWTSQPSRVVRDLGYIMFCGFLDDNLFAWTSIPIGLSYLISYLVLGVVPNGLCDFFFYFAVLRALGRWSDLWGDNPEPSVWVESTFLIGAVAYGIGKFYCYILQGKVSIFWIWNLFGFPWASRLLGMTLLGHDAGTRPPDVELPNT